MAIPNDRMILVIGLGAFRNSALMTTIAKKEIAVKPVLI